VLFVLPWLDTSKVRSMRYRPTAKIFYAIFVVNAFILGWCGAMLPDAPVVPGMPSFTLFDGQLNSYLWLTRLTTLYYFAFFVVILPFVGLKEIPLKIPLSISEPVLKGPDAMSGAVPASPEKKG
jgi:ubiquinol-cytochrome c reductase cytochrome b subunit